MPKLNLQTTRDLLQNFKLQQLFIEELGWLNPASRNPFVREVNGQKFTLKEIAEAGVVVYEVTSDTDTIPDKATRASLQNEITKLHRENLLIFLGNRRTQSSWYWVKTENGKKIPRIHDYFKGQTGDLFIGKLSAMVIDFEELTESGKARITETNRKLREALDVETVTRKFYSDFKGYHDTLLTEISGIDDERDKVWYASVLLNRMMFIYFLQRKRFLDNEDIDYLQNKLTLSKSRGKDCYYSGFLKPLFFDAFAIPELERTAETKALTGKICYLSGSIFLEHPIEARWPQISIPDSAFEKMLNLFSSYTWNLNDTPGQDDNEINPDVLGYIFEKYINDQKAFGAYYTRPEITEYLCEKTIHKLILDKVNGPGVPGAFPARNFETMSDLLMHLDTNLCNLLVHSVLPTLTLLDPACGSGAFLVAAMRTLIDIYGPIFGKIDISTDQNLLMWKRNITKNHPSILYFIKKQIITENLFGVDIMEESTEIAKLRLFLALVSSAEKAEDLEPLPNIDFNILAGNSLIGLMHVSDDDYNRQTKQGAFNFLPTYREVLKEKNTLVDSYRRNTSDFGDHLESMRDKIREKKAVAQSILNELLLEQFKQLKIKFEKATWDDESGQEGKYIKRELTLEHISNLNPFHWGYEFDEIMKRGGFDGVITNPPWEIFKPNSKEFFQDYSDLITKNKMTIHEFDESKAVILQDTEIKDAWIAYLSRFPFVSLYYRSVDQYKNQISIVNGKKQGTDINLYKLFTEQCFNLLKDGGECGIVIPSGIYTDLGTMQLREMLFAKTTITGLFCFENRKLIFEGVDSRYKFVVLTYKKGGCTTEFPAAFMRHDVSELEQFPATGSISMSVDLVRKLSPDSLSVMEFKSALDVQIARKMLQFPLLGETLKDTWNLRFSREFDMTNDKRLFYSQPALGRMPLYEGKMIWQYSHQLASPRYWVDIAEGRKAVLGRTQDSGQLLGYQLYRLGFRDIASATNERTMISTIIPKTFHGNKIPTIEPIDMNGNTLISNNDQLYIATVLNSFILDYMIRQRVTTTLNFFYIYQLPVPRISNKHIAYTNLVNYSAKLIWTDFRRFFRKRR